MVFTRRQALRFGIRRRVTCRCISPRWALIKAPSQRPLPQCAQATPFTGHSSPISDPPTGAKGRLCPSKHCCTLLVCVFPLCHPYHFFTSADTAYNWFVSCRRSGAIVALWRHGGGELLTVTMGRRMQKRLALFVCGGLLLFFLLSKLFWKEPTDWVS